MRRFYRRITARQTVTPTLVAATLCLGVNGPAMAGDSSGSDQSAADKAVVVPYETRPVPSHQIELRDDRVYFTKKLEQNGDTYILHTLEGEVLEFDASEIARIVEYKTE